MFYQLAFLLIVSVASGLALAGFAVYGRITGRRD